MCPMCHSNAFAFLGTLGNRDHARCQSCGWTYSQEVDNDDNDEAFSAFEFNAREDGVPVEDYAY